ncbi:ABC transporter permease subunit [Pseudonocardia nematodicida]|uniref:ABC transporter permease subunit n=1 Tax=Pseudonocardia nematodicida TaxID=1206997 RepID=A0ABV1KIN0_9PSEU
MSSVGTRVLASLAVPVVLVALWWVVSSGSASPYFPPLPDIVEGFAETWTADRLRGDLVPSLVALAVGFVIAVLVGMLGGIVLGLSPRLRRDVRPLTEFLRATPVVALVPLGLVLLGPGTTMEIALIAFAGTWPILIAAVDGVRAADQVALDTARVYGLSPARRLVQVVVPGAMPQIMAGVRIAVAASVGTMVVANMLASGAGLGYVVIRAQQSFNILDTWSGLLMIGLVGCSVTGLVVTVERMVLGWHRRWRALDQRSA